MRNANSPLELEKEQHPGSPAVEVLLFMISIGVAHPWQDSVPDVRVDSVVITATGRCGTFLYRLAYGKNLFRTDKPNSFKSEELSLNQHITLKTRCLACYPCDDA